MIVIKHSDYERAVERRITSLTRSLLCVSYNYKHVQTLNRLLFSDNVDHRANPTG